MAEQLVKNGLTRNGLNSIVDKAADLIRTAVDYKFILVLLFIKRINDQRRTEKLEIVNKLVKKAGLSKEEAEKDGHDGTEEDIALQLRNNGITKIGPEHGKFTVRKIDRTRGGKD